MNILLDQNITLCGFLGIITAISLSLCICGVDQMMPEDII